MLGLCSAPILPGAFQRSCPWQLRRLRRLPRLGGVQRPRAGAAAARTTEPALGLEGDKREGGSFRKPCECFGM